MQSLQRPQHVSAGKAVHHRQLRTLGFVKQTKQSQVIVRAHEKPDVVPGAGNLPSVITNEAVPEGHKSLHNLLYGEGDAHRSARYEFREGEDDGSTILAVISYLDSREGEKPLGVYAIYDDRHNLQYVGYSRNIVLAVKGHVARVGDDRCAYIKPMVFANRAMATRTNMEAQVEDWIAEAGVIPPGNGVEAHLWGAPSAASTDTEEGSTPFDVSLLSPAERAEYEDKKLKLRKAMGDNLLDDEDTDPDAVRRRLALIAAVSGDNWSGVVSEQTQETLQAAAAAGGGRMGGRQMGAPVMAVAAAGPHEGQSAAAAGTSTVDGSSSGTIVSPFTKPTVHRQVGEKHKQAEDGSQNGTPPAMTVDSVDKALDDVRPYLLADGGDVTVVGVENGVVAVALQGACSSCASSSATLKMGIERQLRAVFGDQLSEVVQVDSGGKAKATVETVDLHLNMLRSAVANLGGAVEVASVGSGVAVLHYRGPAAIGKGITAAVKDAFPDIREVVLKEFPAEQ